MKAGRHPIVRDGFELFQGEPSDRRDVAKELGAGTVRSNSSEFRDDLFLTLPPLEAELSKLRTDPFTTPPRPKPTETSLKVIPLTSVKR